MAKNSDSFALNILKDTIAYTSISKDAQGYNSATMVAKINDKEYVRVSYEWSGEKIPGFVMDMMGYMQANNVEIGFVNTKCEEDVKEFLDRDKTRV